jgi:8-amino-7-oxononanoate synthase
MAFPENLSQKLELRVANGSLRRLVTEHGRVDFSSNDYLGFSRNQEINKKVLKHAAELKHVNGSTGSRLLTGNFELHEEVEEDLARFFEAESALLFNSGYDANIGLLSSVPQRGDLILYDELCHASIRDGIRLSNASSFGFNHNSIEDLTKKFLKTKTDKGEVYLVVEAVYSMDGDEAPLVNLVEFSKKFGVRLIVDEAHSTGVFGEKGRGLLHKFNLQDSVFARIHTFGKAMGSHGAVVLGEIDLRNYLINFSRSFIYTTAMPLHNVLCIKYALQELSSTLEIGLLASNILEFKRHVTRYNLDHYFLESSSPIQSYLISPATRLRSIADKLFNENFDARPIFSPTVPTGKERIRFCIHSYNTSEEIQEILFLLSTFA